MILLRRLSFAAALLAALVFTLTLAASLWLERQAEQVQRVLPHDAATAALLGEVGVSVGEPGRYLIFDEAAFLSETAPDGARFVDERYLLENGTYPWQLKTVRFVRNLVVGVSGVALLLFGGVWWFSGRREVSGEARAER